MRPHPLDAVGDSGIHNEKINRAAAARGLTRDVPWCANFPSDVLEPFCHSDLCLLRGVVKVATNNPRTPVLDNRLARCEEDGLVARREAFAVPQVDGDGKQAISNNAIDPGRRHTTWGF